MPVLAELTISDDAEAWADAGFTVRDGRCKIGGVSIRFIDGSDGITAWGFAALDDPVTAIDGVPTASIEAQTMERWTHPNGSTQLDHVVVSSPDSSRTTAALEAVGLPAKRTRDIGKGMQQVFFRAGEVIIELVGPVEPKGDGPAGFYGLAINVEDLDATKASLGERLTDPKDAVQPGRRIATLKTRDLGISTAIAFMTP
ncbi:MAG TPA: hypothetical protein VFU93_06550 [Acidimicrobiales bacterium]|nr:hypothetical protein [Acidimicrobiales bacterium]